MVEKSLKVLTFIRQRNGFSRLQIYIELLYPGLGDTFSKLKKLKKYGLGQQCLPGIPLPSFM